MPRGGKRQGQPGRRYGNRTDMQQGPREQPIMRPPSSRYGEQAELVRSQQALPVQTKSGPAGPRPVAPPAPTQLVPLNAPTQRPTEPLTAGVDVGAGPGAPAPRVSMVDDPVIQELRAIYLAYPNEDLRELLEDYDTGRTF